MLKTALYDKAELKWKVGKWQAYEYTQKKIFYG